MQNPRYAGAPPADCRSRVQMRHCAAVELRMTDAQMAMRYRALRRRLGPAERRVLLDEQRAWLRFRDQYCPARARGLGTLAGTAVAQCWIDLTRAHSRDLANRLVSLRHGGDDAGVSGW